MSAQEALQPLPSPDHQLFNLFASLRLDLHTLAETTGRDLAELIVWASAEHIQLWCRAYLALSDLRIQVLRNDALSALRDTLESPNFVEKRRAATALLRALNARTAAPRPRASSSPRQQPTLHPNPLTRSPDLSSLHEPAPSKFSEFQHKTPAFAAPIAHSSTRNSPPPRSAQRAVSHLADSGAGPQLAAPPSVQHRATNHLGIPLIPGRDFIPNLRGIAGTAPRARDRNCITPLIDHDRQGHRTVHTTEGLATLGLHDQTSPKGRDTPRKGTQDTRSYGYPDSFDPNSPQTPNKVSFERGRSAETFFNSAIDSGRSPAAALNRAAGLPGP